MNAVFSLAVTLVLGSQLGTVKGHVNMKGLGPAGDYEVHFITRPAAPKPGEMEPMHMQMALSTPLGARGDFVAKLRPGLYEIDLWKKNGPSPTPMPTANINLREGRTVRVTLKVPPAPAKP